MRVGGFELLNVAPRGVLLRDNHGACWLLQPAAAAPEARPRGS
jgi:hypothetical protein